jgi:hypothetical protein
MRIGDFSSLCIIIRNRYLFNKGHSRFSFEDIKKNNKGEKQIKTERKKK